VAHCLQLSIGKGVPRKMKRLLRFNVLILLFLLIFSASSFLNIPRALGIDNQNIVNIIQLKYFIENLGHGRINQAAKLANVIYKDSKKYNIDPLLIIAVIQTESNFHIRIMSSKGAVGLMQIMVPTGREIARELRLKRYLKKDLFDPIKNVRMGIYYLGKLKKLFRNDLVLFLTAYNNGPSQLKRTLKRVPASALKFTYAKNRIAQIHTA